MAPSVPCKTLSEDGQIDDTALPKTFCTHVNLKQPETKQATTQAWEGLHQQHLQVFLRQHFYSFLHSCYFWCWEIKQQLRKRLILTWTPWLSQNKLCVLTLPLQTLHCLQQIFYWHHFLWDCNLVSCLENSVHFHNAVDFPHEEETGKESHSTWKI